MDEGYGKLRKMAASHPLRFGLIGLGYFGKNYLRLLQTINGIELVAVATRTPESLSKLPLPKNVIKTTDVESVLKNPEIDCVVIATPPETHLKLAISALKNGKHVLLEKPMVPSLSEAKKLRDAARKSKSTFMVGHQFVYNDHIRYLRDSIESKALGKISHVVGEHLLFNIRNDIGCLWDAGTHQLSMLQYLFNPGKIKKATGSSVDMSGKGFDDFSSVTVKFRSGLLATIIVSWFGTEKTRNITVVGDKKVAFLDDTLPEKKLMLFSRDSPEGVAPKIAAREPLRNEIEHFIHCIATGETPLTGIDKSYEITEWLDKITRSVKRN